LRLSSILPRQTGSAGLSPTLARRLEIFIARKGIQDAGILADFMANVVEATLEDKLQILAAVDVREYASQYGS
jgi:ATP-dependent Lon protease